MENSVSIIIPAWNEEAIIPKTCSFLRKLNLPFDYNELIFIAGGDDKTYEVCKEMKLENFSNVLAFRQKPEDFKSGALIKGIKEAKGEQITLIDADVFVASNLIIETSKLLEKFDAVCCDFIPMMQKGFWYSYYNLYKLMWSSDPNNLNSLIGGTTISLKKDVIDEIGAEKLFSNKSTAGVDYYMGLVLKKNNKRLGFVENTRVLMPRPNNLKDFIRDQKRWLNSYFKLHQDNKKIIFINLILNIGYSLFPPLIFLSNYKKMRKIRKIYPKLNYFFILFFVDFIINLRSIVTFLKILSRNLKYLSHFKGEDRYI